MTLFVGLGGWGLSFISSGAPFPYFQSGDKLCGAARAQQPPPAADTPDGHDDVARGEASGASACGRDV